MLKIKANFNSDSEDSKNVSNYRFCSLSKNIFLLALLSCINF